MVRGFGNAAHLKLEWLSEDVDEVREAIAELWLGQWWLRCHGELERARWADGVGGVLLRFGCERGRQRRSE